MNCSLHFKWQTARLAGCLHATADFTGEARNSNRLC